MFLLPPKPKLALTASSVITAVNLEQFLALPTTDTEMGGPGWNLYFGFCKLQSANVASTLTTLNARQIADYEGRYKVNFPYLLIMLMARGSLTIKQTSALLVWHRKVAEANFDAEFFVYQARDAIKQTLLRIDLVIERLDQIGELITRLSPVENWRWRDAFVWLIQNALPEDGFAGRVIAPCIHLASDHKDTGVKNEHDLRLLLQVLKQVFEKHG